MHTIMDAYSFEKWLVERVLKASSLSELIVLLVLCMGKYVESASPSYNNPVNQSTNQQQKITNADLFIGKHKDQLINLGDAVLDMVVLISVRFIYAGTVVFDSLRGRRYC